MRISDWSSDVCSSDLRARPSSSCTTHPNNESIPKKNRPRRDVMITTMMVVTIVSRLVGNTILLASARICRTKSPGDVLATRHQPVQIPKKQRNKNRSEERREGKERGKR